MHIYEGVLAASPQGREVLFAGTLLAASCTAWGVKKLDPEQLPRVALLSAAFFVISTIHVPLWPTSVHLMLTGLMGLMLGWTAFPAVFVALLLQALLFSYGGLTTLGLNTFIMAAPAVVCHSLFRRTVAMPHEGLALSGGFVAGALAILLSAILVAVSLMLGGKNEFDTLGKFFAVLQVPQAIVEGFVTAGVVVLVRRAKPELFCCMPLQSVPVEIENG
jgi:cobalt/nickel transport system permease protein